MYASRSNILITSAFMILLILLGGVFYLYLEVKNQNDALRSEFLEIQSQLEDFRQIQSQLENIRQIRIVEDVNYSSIPCEVYESIKPSIVKITNKKISPSGLQPYSEGSGFVYDWKGHVITNNHVVEGADYLDITFLDGSVYRAELIGTDVYSDLAILKVDLSAKELRPVFLGNSSVLCVGERVFAIGSPFGLSGSMSEGIVSQIGRTMQAAGGYLIVGVIQVDAAINPGNSGGPLLNMKGEVIGVNTAIQSETGVFSGVGFAVPSNLVKRVVPSLISYGEYKHPWIGISGLDLSIEIAEKMGLRDTKGFLITDVIEGSPADEAGLRGGTRTEMIENREIKIGGDVVIGEDNINVSRLEDLLVYFEFNKHPGDKVVLRVIRDGKLMDIEVLLGERPLPK